MPKIPEETIQTIKHSVDLVSFCRSRDIKLKKTGKDFIGKCPFHDDDQASFTVNPRENLWHCFGCNTGGDVIRFVELLDKCSFREAVETLSNKAVKPAIKEKKPSFSSRDRCLSPLDRSRLLSLLVDFYHAAFNQRKDGKEYLSMRGISDVSLISRFKIGFCSGTIRESIPKDGEMQSDLKALGVINGNGRELFKNCVVFPIPAASGRIVNLYGRRIRDGQVNHLYLPGSKQGIFNAAAIKGADQIILVESILDAMALIQAGYPGAIPCFGSTGIPDQLLEAVKKHPEKPVSLCFDSDKAGQTAAARAKLQLEGVGITSHQIMFPEGHDPCSLLQDKTGKVTFNQLMRNAGRGGKPSMSGKKAVPNKITRENGKLRVIFDERIYELQGFSREPTKCKATVKVFGNNGDDRFHLDTIDLYSSRSRSVFARGVAELFSVRDAQTSAEILALLAPVEKYREAKDKEPESEKPEMTDQERKDALALLKTRDIFERILNDFEAAGYTGEEVNKLVGYLATVSRKLDEPISICIQSRSAAGKSALQDAILNFVPPEDVVRYTCLTGQALFYKEADSLKHKILAIEEDAGAKNANYSIRTMQSSNHLSIAAAGRDPETGKLRTEENIVEGPTPFFMTTTAPEIESETGSRFLFLTLDESNEATARVHEAQRMMNTLEGLVTRKKVEKVIKLHQNAQRLLRNGLKVVIPFAKHLSFGVESLRARRDHKKYLTLIQAIAFLRQYQRDIKTVDVEGETVQYIEADLDDVRLANKLAAEVLGTSLDELSPPSRRLLGRIREMVITKSKEHGVDPKDFSFTRRDIREYTGWSDTQVKRHINQLVDLEYIFSLMGSKGKEYMYELRFVDEVEPNTKFLSCLIDVDELEKRIKAESDDNLGG